ncbi:MAG: hypothetical protein QF535_21540 [Anaerolineales bacterium]|nr:hypothetical protein [Anaerolineales bacterium]
MIKIIASFVAAITAIRIAFQINSCCFGSAIIGVVGGVGVG